MKIAVITPFHGTPRAWLEQCLHSAARQTVPCTHFLVCDGDSTSGLPLPPSVQLIQLPRPHRDAGDAARAIGSVSAIAQDFDGIAYLDADNWYEPHHLQVLCRLHEHTQAAVCSCSRNLYALDGTLLGRCPEVDGKRFVDTSCLFLTRPAFPLVAAWFLVPRSQALVGDRIVWQAIKDSGLRRAHHDQPTLCYRTAWSVHYRHFGKEPPEGAKPNVPFIPARRLTVPLLIQEPAPSQPAPQPTPVRKPRVSLCMIVRNEEAKLARCLRSVADLVDEMIVVDTGSTDRTLEIALSLGARVIDFPWCDSFAAARNESLRHASGEWIFWLDADETLDEKARQGLRKLLAELPQEKAAYMMRQWSVPDPTSGSAVIVDHVRLFPRLEGLAWRYRVHEQVLLPLQELGVRTQWTDIVIRHTGYQDPALRRHKLQRNLRLLEMDARENPDDPIPLFSLAGTLLDLKRTEEALDVLRRCLELAPSGASFLARTYFRLAQACRVLGQREEAERHCREGLARFPKEAELWLELGQLQTLAGDLDAARESFEKVLALPRGHSMSGASEGVQGHLTRHLLAQVHRRQGRPEEARAQWREAVKTAPQFGPAWLGLADLALEQGQPQEIQRMIAELEGRPRHQGVVLLLRARLLWSSGETAQARALLEDTIARAPTQSWVRLMLAEMLLKEGADLPAAESHLRMVLEQDPGNAQAQQLLKQVRQKHAGEPLLSGKE